MGATDAGKEDPRGLEMPYDSELCRAAKEESVSGRAVGR